MEIVQAENYSKQIYYGANISPNISDNKIKFDNLKWYHDQSTTSTHEGKRNFVKWLPARDNSYFTKVIAGYPEEKIKEKTVEVKWVDEYKNINEQAIGGISALIQDLFENKINKINDFLPGNLEFGTSVSFSNETSNKENESNRFLTDVKKKVIQASALIEAEMPLPGLSFTIPYLGSIGGFIKGIGSLGVEYEKISEKSNIQQDSEYVIKKHNFGPKGQLCLNIGAKIEILPNVDAITVEGRGFGEACVVVEGEIEAHANGDYILSYEVYVEPLFGVVSAKITSGNFDVFEDSWRKQIFSRIDIISDGEKIINND